MAELKTVLVIDPTHKDGDALTRKAAGGAEKPKG